MAISNNRGAGMSSPPSESSPDTGYPINPADSLLGEKEGIEIALWRAFCRHWISSISAGFILGASLAVPVWLWLPAKHMAQVTLRVMSTVPSILIQGSGSGSPDFLRAQQYMLKSTPVLEQALKDEKVAILPKVRASSQPTVWLEQQLVIAVVPPEILTLSVQGDSDEEAVGIADAVSRAYLDEVVGKERKQRNDRITELEKTRDSYALEITTWKREIYKLTEQNGAADPKNLALKDQFDLECAAIAHRDILSFQAELLRLELEAQLRRAAGDKQITPAFQTELEERMRRDPDLGKLEQQRAEVENQLEELRKRAQPEVAAKTGEKYRVDKQSIEASIEARRQKVRALFLDQPRAQPVSGPEMSLNQIELRIRFLKSMVEKYKDELQRSAKTANDTNHLALAVELLRDKIALREEIAHQISRQVESLRVELNAPSRVTLQAEAHIIPSNDLKRRIIASGLSGLSGFCLGLFGIVWWEFQAKRIRTPEEISRNLGMRLVGELPALINGSSQASRTGESISNEYRNTPFVEYLDATCARLLYSARMEPFRIVMITSASPGEGKTSLSCHLATSLARGGRKTLLLDCDLRKPSAHHLFDVARAPGMSEVLRGEVELDSSVVPTVANGLFILPAGKWDQCASQGLANEARVRAVLDQLRQEFDFVIVDSSPILAAADGLWMAQYADAVIFSILHGVSHEPSVRTAYAELSAMGVRVLGAVIGGRPAEKAYYYNYADYSRRPPG